MKKIIGLIAMCVAMFYFSFNSGDRLIPAADSDLASSVGGACYKCLGSTYDVACNTGFKPACELHTGYCFKWTFTGINVNYCLAAGAGEAGARGCTAYSPQVCVRMRTCSTCDGVNPCTNCGAESTEDKPTQCSLIPYSPCTG